MLIKGLKSLALIAALASMSSIAGTNTKATVELKTDAQTSLATLLAKQTNVINKNIGKDSVKTTLNAINTNQLTIQLVSNVIKPDEDKDTSTSE